MKKWLGLIAGIICGMIVYVIVDAKMNEQYAISIIGGADGPTSIWIAGRVGGGDVFLALAATAAVIVLIVCLVRRKKK